MTTALGGDVETVLDAAALARLIDALAGSIRAAAGPSPGPVLVALAPRAGPLADAVAAALGIPHERAELALTTPADGDRARVVADVTLPLAGRDVVVLDVVVDTGLTLHFALDHLARSTPARLAACVLVDRPGRRLFPALPLAHVGLVVSDDRFLAGFGLEADGALGDLPRLVAVP